MAAYSEKRRAFFWNPVVMESPSGEVHVTLGQVLSKLPGVPFRWVLKVRGMYATGRGGASLVQAMSDFSGRLAPAGSPAAAELGRLASMWAAGD